MTEGEGCRSTDGRGGWQELVAARWLYVVGISSPTASLSACLDVCAETGTDACGDAGAFDECMRVLMREACVQGGEACLQGALPNLVKKCEHKKKLLAKCEEKKRTQGIGRGIDAEERTCRATHTEEVPRNAHV